MAKARPPLIIRPSSTINASEDGTIFTNRKISGGFLLLDITELGASQTIKLGLKIRDIVSDVWRFAELNAAETSTGLKFQAIGLNGIASSQMASTQIMDIPLPYEWRFHYQLFNAANATFSLSLVPFPQPS